MGKENSTTNITKLDDFPYNATQWNDTDGDGWGDNYPNASWPNERQWPAGAWHIPDAYGPDRFPFEPTQWNDTDGDGWGDNYANISWGQNRSVGIYISNAYKPDRFPLDPARWNDTNGNNEPPDLDGDGTPDYLDPDSDGDGYNNTIEIEAGTDPYDNTSFPSDLDGDGIPDLLDPDIDGDGWNNTIEIEAGTDPYDNTSFPSDLDGDGIPDALDPDIDGDGYNNTDEERAGTDPYDNRSFPSGGFDDDDTGSDTNDTDDDGMPDWWEKKYYLDPDDPGDARGDPDNDGLTNLEEYQLTDVYGNSTDPTNPDTDGDGYDDGYEVERGANPLDASDHPGRLKEEINVLVIIVIAGAAAVVILAGFICYSRIRKSKEKLLDNENRQEILSFVVNNPGTHYRGMKRGLGISRGSLSHHLRLLEKENLIEVQHRGNFKFFYPVGENDEPRPLTPIQKKMVEIISSKPGSTNRSLADMLGKSERSISYHTKNLEDIGAVRPERDGENELHWFVDGGDDPVSAGP